ncbi:MAG: formylmethanofuran dehydrogenase subunit B [Gemmataceae bacterium]
MTTIHHVACTVCGCVCDDLSVTVEDGRIASFAPPCPLAAPWLLGQNSCHPASAFIDGRPADVESAYRRAAELLHESHSPLIYGLSRSTTDGQRAATALAELLGGTIDTTASTGHAPSLLALQDIGESTCTLGEIKNRADLVIYWGSDPVHTHPRHMERYAVQPRGRFVPNGRADRFVVVADDVRTDSAAEADLFLPLTSGSHWEAFETLRMLVKGLPCPDASAAMRLLAEKMKACRCGVIFFGHVVVHEPAAHRTVASLLQLVTDLNSFTRFYARRMRRYGDVAGADAVLSWQTCYPFGVNFARGFPRYNPGEFTGPDMLSRGEVDAALIVCGETAADLPPAALNRLRSVPVILLDPPGAEPVVPAAVRFTTAVYGVHRPGTAYRMDNVPIPLRTLLPTNFPSDDEVLSELHSRLASIPSDR